MSYFSNPYTPRDFEGGHRAALCQRCSGRVAARELAERTLLVPVHGGYALGTVSVCAECSAALDLEVGRRVWLAAMAAVGGERAQGLCDGCMRPYFEDALQRAAAPVPVGRSIVAVEVRLCPRCLGDLAALLGVKIQGEIERAVGGGDACSGQWEQV